MRVRKATPEDLEEILTIINITNRLFFKEIIPPERFKDPFMTREELEQEFEQKDFYIFELEGRKGRSLLRRQLVGVAAFETSTTRFGTVGIITRMYVLPQFQRRGIGTALIAEIESKAREQGVEEILIWTDPKATWAVSFYKKAGYREIDPAARYGDEAIDTRITKHGKELLVLRKAL
jgi:GNAT superfamily N-acetyltransferase